MNLLSFHESSFGEKPSNLAVFFFNLEQKITHRKPHLSMGFPFSQVVVDILLEKYKNG